MVSVKPPFAWQEDTLPASDTVFEVVLVDVNEQLVECPKLKTGTTVAKRRVIPKKRR